jgi:hypothetical protein
MNLLYLGQYKRRFTCVTNWIKGNNVVELCFADLQIAKHCKKKNKNWKGFDLNESFVSFAQRHNFDAIKSNIDFQESFPKCDTLIICGSLYHFQLEIIIKKCLQSSSTIIISEPVKNLASYKGIIGALAKRLSSINGKAQSFRYTEESLLSGLMDLSQILNFKYQIVERFSKDIIILIEK